MATLSGDAFFESPSGDGSFGVAASPPLLCVFSSSSGSSGASTASARAPARVVSGALATCETPPLAALLGVGGGDAALALAPEGERAAGDDAAARVAAAPTPWVLAHAPRRGGASGGVSVTVTVGGAVEGVRGRAVVPRASPGDENEDNKGLAATKTSCAFGAVAPVAARAAGGASSRDVTCVSPASRPGALAPLRVFAGAAVVRAAVAARAPPRTARATRLRSAPIPRRPRDGGDAFSFARRSLGTRALRARRRLGLASADACAHGAAGAAARAPAGGGAARSR